MKHLNQIFFKGLIVVLPISLTFYLLVWASLKIESLFASSLQYFFKDLPYIPGFGVALSIVLIFFIGLLVNNYITGRFFRWFSELLEKLPLIKVIYNPLKDLMALIPGKSSEKKLQRVVLVPLPGLGVKVLGLVTREELDELAEKNLVPVYIPLSYMLGGITVLADKESLTKVDITVDQALKLSVTAWIKADPRKQ